MPTLLVRSDRLVLAAAPLILIATILSATQGGLAGVVTLAITLAASFAVAWRVARPGDLRFVLAVALGTLVLRDIAAGLLDAYLADRSRYRALFYDDGAYILYARQMAEFWKGADIAFPSDPSVRNSYAIGLGTLFSLIGENVMVVRLLNSFALSVTGLLTYRTMLNLDLRGARWALLGVLLFPSLTLWSILALKDSYVLAWIVAAVWASSEFVRSGRYVWFLPTVLALFVLDGARRYIFLVLALAWPLGLAIALTGRRRVLAGGLVAICSLALVWSSRALETHSPETIGMLSGVRAAMAQGARSALVEPLPMMHASAGDRLLVTVADGAACSVPGAEVEVPLGSKVIARAPGAAPRQDSSVVYVTPCDVIVLTTPVVGARAPTRSTPLPGAGTLSPTPQPTPTRSPQPIVLVPGVPGLIAAAPQASVDPQVPGEPSGFQRGLAESLAYLPTGMLFYLSAPFPLNARTPSEMAAIPEMLLWYVTVMLALYGSYRLLRARNLGYAFGALALCGITLVLSLAEGNAGTLIRHRAMAIVFVVVFAAVGLDAFLARTARRTG